MEKLNRKKLAFGGSITHRKGQKGQVTMEFIVIALLVAAAAVGLIMVFSGNLRNMFSKTNQTLNAKTVDEVKQAGEAYNAEQDQMKTQNDTATQAGDKLGGDFSGARNQDSGK